eukprot:TRINITY_DN479_c1_g1_i3.p1 TRINITY_DN479_c1_g1~~TRINITY_DN479_c1_g1_i3.p1  ORF type:complete len:192 (+),score=53.58 TRINITY_DN479_c1_g1_i3:53-628(+)
MSCDITENFFAAIEQQNLKIVEQCLNEQPNLVTEIKSLQSPLFFAVYFNNIQMCKLLMDKGADVNLGFIDCYESFTPISIAAARGYIEIFNFLIEKEASVNEGDVIIPLCAAASNGHINICKILIEKGADINIKNNSNEIAIKSAVVAGQFEISKILIVNGANIEEIDYYNNEIEATSFLIKAITNNNYKY